MQQNEKTAVAKPYDVVISVAAKLRDYAERGELRLPTDYSVENALKSAWLLIQETVDKEKRPVLTVCTQTSIANSLLDMAIQGLSPAKKQCYFIPYGQKLLCQRSYFGTIAVAKRVAPIANIWAEVVYEDDEFSYEITRNRKLVTQHTQKLSNVKADKIIAAYCVIEFANERPTYTEIMTIEQIKKAWAKSRMSPESPTSTHSLFPEEMAKRTVINRACKPVINASSDSHLFLESFRRADDERIEEEVAQEIAENANQEVIDVDMATGEIIEDEPPPEEVISPLEEGRQELMGPGF